SMVLLRYAVALALDVDSLATGSWARRGLDVERGFALVVGARREGGRWPLAAAAWPVDGAALGRWLDGRGVRWRRTDGGPLTLGHGRDGQDDLVGAALGALAAPWPETPATRAPYLEVTSRFGAERAL